ncbi:MAG TPA: T9SS type A sorting domain-containing protein, partial [Saprospiraceae bacterium]|nr:T9SS type A sorting domain-containing protein [Saprospiraceae bacterium]
GERIAVLSHQPVRMLPGRDAEMLLAVLWSQGAMAGPLSGYPTLLTDASWIHERYNTFEDPAPWMPSCLSYTVGLPEEPLLMRMTASPLPADESVRLTLDEAPGEWSVEAYDALGGRVFSAQIQAPAEGFEVDTGAWPQGVYWMRISDGKGKTGVKKVLVHHR